MKLEPQQSKYLTIYEELLTTVRNAESGAEQYLPSERSLSVQFGADRLTVRKAIDLLVNDGMVKKLPGKGSLIIPVSDVSEKRKYAKSVVFILPRGNNSIDRITEPFNAELLAHTEKELKNKGYHLLYSTVDEDGSLPESVSRSKSGGIIFVSKVPAKSILEARQKRLPAVLINNVSDHFPMILEDRYKGFSDILNNLYESGHRRILFINGKPGYYTTDACEDAFRLFTASHIEDGVEAGIIPADFNYESGEKVMRQVLSSGNSIPTAVCACNDMVAIGAMNEAEKSGFNVPGDISFIGFDNSTQCVQSRPQLSTVNVNTPVIAKFAVETLFSSIGSENPGPVRTIIPTQFIKRESNITLIEGEK